MVMVEANNMRNKISVIIALSILVITGLLIEGNYCYSRAVEKKDILYWTCGMHPQVKQEKPGNCPICNMKLIPVYREEAEKEAVEEEVFYGCGVKEEGHCPHCDEGKPDAGCVCGEHSFIIKGKALTECPVCKRPLGKICPSPYPLPEGEKGSMIISRVKLNKRQQELAGIKTATLTRLHLSKDIRTVGKIAYDPELIVAQEEFLTALETKKKVSNSPDPDVISRANDILERSKTKLRLLGLSEQEIIGLEEKSSLDRSLILPEDKMWVYADVYEYELGWIKTGEKVKVTTVAYPGEEFRGEIMSINPVLDPNTRSAKVRIQVNNPDLKLKPEMYVDVIIKSMYQDLKGEDLVLAVPQEAVLDTGTRKIVYLKGDNLEYLGKEVKLGPLASTEIEGASSRFYPVLEGLKEGDIVVTKGNFLIDSQSQLTGGMSVLWGGASEIKEQGITKDEIKPVQTQHKH
jgi:hypothetical protein